MMQDVSLAAVVGKAVIDRISCDHLLVRRPGVDFQIRIAAGEKPWPYKYLVIETDTPTKLSITTFLSNWNFAPALPDSEFNFVPPKDARVIPMPNASADCSADGAGGTCLARSGCRIRRRLAPQRLRRRHRHRCRSDGPLQLVCPDVASRSQVGDAERATRRLTRGCPRQRRACL
jgi:hypothetical protein